MYCAAIDQGTTRQFNPHTITRSSRVIVFDHSGSVVSVAQKEHEQIYPHPGWVEHDPITILENVKVRLPVLRNS